MKKKIKILIFSGIILALLVAALVVVLNLPSTDESTNEVSSQDAILLFDKTNLKAEDITVSNESGKYQLLGYEYSDESDSAENSEQKSEIVYTMQDYSSQILSKTMTDSLAEQCLYMSAIQIVDKSGNRYAEYGLDKPRSTVSVIFSDDSEVTMYVGNNAPDNKGVYFRIDGNANVYLVQQNMINMFLVDKFQMFSKTMSYSFDTDYKIQTVKISGTNFDSNIEIEPINNNANFCNFVITKPYREICNNDFLETFGESLYGLNGTTVVAVDITEDDMKKYGLDKPYIDVEVTASDDTSVHIIASKADSDKNCYIMKSGGTIIYKMSTDELSWYGVTYRDFLDDSIIRPNMNNILSADIYYGDKNYHYDVTHTTSKNDLYEDIVTTTATYNGKEIKYLNLSIFVNNVAGISRSDAVPKSIDGCEKIFSIKYSFDGDDNLTDTLEIYKAKDKQLIVTLNGNIEGYTDTEYAEKVFEQVENIPKNAELAVLNSEESSAVSEE
ncbi:MAG: DUF4340 domain-containing protein [Acutalibacteraceae bacterium]